MKTTFKCILTCCKAYLINLIQAKGNDELSNKTRFCSCRHADNNQVYLLIQHENMEDEL